MCEQILLGMGCLKQNRLEKLSSLVLKNPVNPNLREFFRGLFIDGGGGGGKITSSYLDLFKIMLET